MPRWKQTSEVDPTTGRFKMVPVGDSSPGDGHFIHGDIEAFRSPIDGTVIADRHQMDEHCKRHGVVPAGEFSPEFYAQKARERADVYEGRHSSADKFARKQQIHEAFNRAERQ